LIESEAVPRPHQAKERIGIFGNIVDRLNRSTSVAVLIEISFHDQSIARTTSST